MSRSASEVSSTIGVVSERIANEEAGRAHRARAVPAALPARSAHVRTDGKFDSCSACGAALEPDDINGSEQECPKCRTDRSRRRMVTRAANAWREPLDPGLGEGNAGGPGFRPGNVFEPQLGGSGTVVGNFDNMPFDQALDLVLGTHNLKKIVYRRAYRCQRGAQIVRDRSQQGRL